MQNLTQIKNQINKSNAKSIYTACSDWMSGNKKPLLGWCDGYIPKNPGIVNSIMTAAFTMLPDWFKSRDYEAAKNGVSLKTVDFFN